MTDFSISGQSASHLSLLRRQVRELHGLLSMRLRVDVGQSALPIITALNERLLSFSEIGNDLDNLFSDMLEKKKISQEMESKAIKYESLLQQFQSLEVSHLESLETNAKINEENIKIRQTMEKYNLELIQKIEETANLRVSCESYCNEVKAKEKEVARLSIERDNSKRQALNLQTLTKQLVEEKDVASAQVANLRAEVEELNDKIEEERHSKEKKQREQNLALKEMELEEELAQLKAQLPLKQAGKGIGQGIKLPKRESLTDDDLESNEEDNESNDNRSEDSDEQDEAAAGSNQEASENETEVDSKRSYLPSNQNASTVKQNHPCASSQQDNAQVQKQQVVSQKHNLKEQTNSKPHLSRSSSSSVSGNAVSFKENYCIDSDESVDSIDLEVRRRLQLQQSKKQQIPGDTGDLQKQWTRKAAEQLDVLFSSASASPVSQRSSQLIKQPSSTSKPLILPALSNNDSIIPIGDSSFDSSDSLKRQAMESRKQRNDEKFKQNKIKLIRSRSSSLKN